MARELAGGPASSSGRAATPRWLAFGRKFDLRPRISFGAPASASELARDPAGARAALLDRARVLLGEHMAFYV